MVQADPDRGSFDRKAWRLVMAVAAPLAVVGLAYALWWISDRLLYVGPLDRAAFGWAVVIPVWLSTPVVAGFAWHGLTRRDSRVAALVVGAVISGVTAILFWQAVAYPPCEYGATHTPGDWVLPSIVLGVVVGGGLAASGLLATSQVRSGHPWRAAILGAGAELGMVFVAILVASAVLIGTACQRPPL